MFDESISNDLYDLASSESSALLEHLKTIGGMAMDYRPNRRPTRVGATLVVDDLILQTTVVDISRDGARLNLPGWIAPGTAVYVRVGAASVPALVHWMEDGHAGVRFFDRLDRDTLVALEAADDPLADWR